MGFEVSKAHVGEAQFLCSKPVDQYVKLSAIAQHSANPLLHDDCELTLENCEQAPSELLSFIRVALITMGSLHGNRTLTKTPNVVGTF